MDGLWYAREMEFHDLDRETSLRLKLGEMTFNRAVSEELFKLEVPPGFSIYSGK